MPTYALTGGTGQLGQNMLYEIVRHHLDDLAQLRILCLGRGGGTDELRARLGQCLDEQGWGYLGLAEEDPRRGTIREAVVPVVYDLKRDDLGLGPEARQQLGAAPIDHFFHVAALTDFRHAEYVAERLALVNIEGTRRVLDLVAGLSAEPKTFSYISSAYCCGLTFGAVSPDAVSFDQPFQNPYQRTKLQAEVLVREMFAKRKSKLRVFRPTTVAGRLHREPRGFVTKFDVYLGWGRYFLKRKVDHFVEEQPSVGFTELLGQPYSMDVRIRANTRAGLNIVPADYSAEVILAAVLGDHPGESYHIMSEQDFPIGDLLSHIVDRMGVDGYSFTEETLEPPYANDFEEGYYATVGALYTPYIHIPSPMEFDPSSMLDVCKTSGIEPVSLQTIPQLDVMLDYAFAEQFGFDLPP